MPVAITPSVAVAGVGANLLDLCRRVADTVGFRLETSISTEASYGETSRVVLADELRDDENSYEFVARDWIYVSTEAQAQTQRRILAQPEIGYQGARGAAVVSRPFNAALEVGSVIDVTSPLPMRQHRGVQGYREAINQGLGLIWIPARLTMTGDGTYEHDLAAFSAYLDRPDVQIQSLEDTQALGTTYPAEMSPFGHRIVANGVSRTLVTEAAYASGEAFYLDVRVRGDRLIHDGSSWGYVMAGPTGLQNDTDQTAAPGDWAYVFGVWKAYQNWSKMVSASKTMSAEEKAAVLDGADGVLARRYSWSRAAARIKQRWTMNQPSRPIRGLAEISRWPVPSGSYV